MPVFEDYIEIFGAREHNLKNIDVRIPRNALVVLTGISGSGKSSLAFNTIYAEGQRRYMESFSAYARSFIGNMERPDVDKISGLSPVISIEQKTTSRNPRSTVGTSTEVYDFLRLFFARAADAFSFHTGEKMIKQTEQQILEMIKQSFENQMITLLSPLVRARKGHYKELFVALRKKGYTKARIDGQIINLEATLQLDRYKTHDIELVIDRLEILEKNNERLVSSLKVALKEGNGILMLLDNNAHIRYFSKHLMCPSTGIAYDEPAPNLFSFNSPYGACPTCNGLGAVQELDFKAIIPDPSLSISQGAIVPLGTFRDIWIFKKIDAILKASQLSLSTPIEKIPEKVMDLIFHGSESEMVLSDPQKKNAIFVQFDGLVKMLSRQKESSEENERQATSIDDYYSAKPCPDCHGARLKKEALYFKIDQKNIAQLAQMSIDDLYQWVQQLLPTLSERQQAIAHDVLKELTKRIGFLVQIGLGYLTLDRPMRTLSGGESQRIRLATQIGSQLVGVLYILDEPSIGLHQRDNAKLISALQNLRDIGNSVLVVEHDKDMMLQADYILDIGPGAGVHGGRIVAAERPQEILKMAQQSTTAAYLAGIKNIDVPTKRRKGNGKQLTLTGLTGNNLKNIDVSFPLGKMIGITGVSGSGKSTLIHHTLYPILAKHFYRAHKLPMPYQTIDGIEHIDKVIEVDQAPIGRTPRSNPATYTGLFAEIRNIFAQLPESKIRGYKVGRFSFNIKGGRCETCQGGGKKVIEMDFLPDVLVECEDCKGKRYNRETLEVRYKGKSIADVLEMTVATAVTFFEKYPKIEKKLSALHDVGLGYLTLGQHATTLSGGEAQRVKLATELAKKDTGKTFYILDEPTTGLHFQDIVHLLHVLNKLADKGNTVLVIEHNLDVIKVCDYLIDIGLEGGNQGGYVVAQGTPEQVAQHPESLTGLFLKAELPNVQPLSIKA